MATAVVQERPVVMRERSIMTDCWSSVKEAACVLLLLLVIVMYAVLAHGGPECVVPGSRVDGYVQPAVVFLLGGQLAVFHNLGLSALL
jgi:hypothetical protein